MTPWKLPRAETKSVVLDWYVRVSRPHSETAQRVEQTFPLSDSDYLHLWRLRVERNERARSHRRSSERSGRLAMTDEDMPALLRPQAG